MIARGDVGDCDQPPRLAHAPDRSRAAARRLDLSTGTCPNFGDVGIREHRAAADPPDGGRRDATRCVAHDANRVVELADAVAEMTTTVDMWVFSPLPVIRSLAAIGDHGRLEPIVVIVGAPSW